MPKNVISSKPQCKPSTDAAPGPKGVLLSKILSIRRQPGLDSLWGCWKAVPLQVSPRFPVSPSTVRAISILTSKGGTLGHYISILHNSLGYSENLPLWRRVYPNPSPTKLRQLREILIKHFAPRSRLGKTLSPAIDKKSDRNPEKAPTRALAQ